MKLTSPVEPGSIFTATRAFRRVKCKACGRVIRPGFRVQSNEDGFRHIVCAAGFKVVNR